MTPQQETRLLKLLDKADIREVIETYVHAQDRADVEATIDVYHPDSWDNHGPLDSDGHTFSRNSTQALLDNWKSCLHLLGQSRIRVDGDTAGGETYFYCTMTREEDGVPMLDQMVGRYIDRVERREGVWRIKDRRCIVDWITSAPQGADWIGCETFMKGTRDQSDPSYDVLQLVRGNSRVER